MQVLANDGQLYDAIRHELGRQGTGTRWAKPMHAGAVAKLRQRHQKLLDLYYADKISPSMFADEERLLTKQIETHELQAAEAVEARQRQNILADHFERVLLRERDIDRLWEAASDTEKRTLVNELIECVIVHPDRLQVAINRAPPLTVDFEEVGLRSAGMRNGVSKDRTADPHTGHWRLGNDHRDAQLRRPREP